jgi:hypothetical protein
VRRGLVLLAVFSACLSTGVAGAAPHALIVARSTVKALAADGDQVAFAAAPTKADCRDRVFIWQKLPPATFQLGKNQRCVPRTAPVRSVAVSGGRALWLNSTGSRNVDWQLWTATTTKKAPRLLEFISRGPDDPQPIVLGVAGDGLLPYALNTTVTVLKASGSTAFTWAASAPVVALTAAGGRVAVAEQGGRVTVLDAHGKIVSVDLYASDVTAVFFVTKGLLVQRGVTLELRRGADAHEFAMTADAHLYDAGGKWGAWSDGKLVHVVRLPDGAQTATYAGSSAALVGNRLYAANGRTITVRTIR